MKTLDKFTQLNFIGDIWAPKYSTNEVYIAPYKINRSKLDIKLRFSKVNDTDEWTGDWFISRKKAKSFRKKFDNNGLQCYVVPLNELEKLIINKEPAQAW